MPNAADINGPDCPMDIIIELIGIPYISLVSMFKNCVNILVEFELLKVLGISAKLYPNTNNDVEPNSVMLIISRNMYLMNSDL